MKYIFNFIKNYLLRTDMRKIILKLLLFAILFSGSVFAGTKLTKTEVSELYVTLMGRVSEGKGSSYWQNSYSDQTKAAKAMLDSQAVANYFGVSSMVEMSNEDFIGTIYKNTLNKTIDGSDGTIEDASGISYWNGRLTGETGSQMSRADMIVEFITIAQKSTTVSGKQFSNRVEVSNYMADVVETAPSDYETSTSFTGGLRVTSDLSTVNSAKEQISLFVGETPTPVLTSTPTPTPTPTPISTSTCTPIANDTSYNDVFPYADIKWSSSGDSVKDIEDAFNYARAKDLTISKALIMPSQSKWDAMSNQEKALYLTNKERYDRGIKPFEGIDSNVVNVAQNYAELLYSKGTFGHNEDGSPWERLDSVDVIKNNKDFFAYGENLYVVASKPEYTKNPIAKAIYGWIYDDAGSEWGHRKFSLATGLNDNSGEVGAEGLMGFGVIKGDEYNFYAGWKSTIIVMNVFDPSSSWNHVNTISVSICTNSSTDDSTDNDSPAKRFTVDASTGTAVDTETELMWQNAELAQKTPREAMAQCANLTFAGYSDWELPTEAQSKIFHFEMNAQGDVPKQLFSRCTAEVVADGYVRTQKGAEIYGGVAGDPIGFSGGANVRCIRVN
jgi:uncharacterized protein YkwD